MKCLSVNVGSSSLKFRLFEMPGEKVLLSGHIEKIGHKDSFWTTRIKGQKHPGARYLKNHAAAAEVVKEELLKFKAVESLDEIKGVGHRVLHGGEKYFDSVLITDEVIDDIKELTKLGPLHHPGNLAGIEAMKAALPNAPMVAVFDTAFHQTMPKENYMYPVPYEWYEKYGVRKYGFHGSSHKFITQRMMKLLGKRKVNLIVCHIGSGSSITAIKDSKSYDTTMGLTPLDGLMMGTRSGSIDPSIVDYMCRETGKPVGEINNALNMESGSFGVCGENDSRDIEALAEKGDEKAKLAIRMYNDRVAKYIVDYYIELGGKVDAIVFTAGAGENGISFREDVMKKLAPLGIKINKSMNAKVASFKDIHEGKISSKNSSVDVYVVPTNEESIIIGDTYRICNEYYKNKK